MFQQEDRQQETCQTCGSMHQGTNCSTNVTKFIWKYGGNKVFVSGSWNQWQASIQLNPMPENKRWQQVTLSLPCGTYQYKFIVDDQWVYDQNENKVSDGLKGFNNIVEVFPKNCTYDSSTENDMSENEGDGRARTLSGLSPLKNQKLLKYQQQVNYYRKVKITTGLDAESIIVIGSWDDWKNQVPMTRKFNNVLNRWENEAEIKLRPGKYFYKFQLNGIFICDNQQKMVKNEFGSYNNLIFVPKQSVNHQIQQKKKCFNPYVLKWKYEFIYNIGSEKMVGHSMDVIGDCLYIYGGQKGVGECRDSMYQLNLATWEIDTVEYENQAPPARAFHSTVTYGDKILVLGGIGQDQILTDCQIFNINYRTWQEYHLQGETPSVREKSSVCYFSQTSCLILFGGYYCTEDLEAEYHYNDLYSMNLNTLVWSQINTIGEKPKERFSAGMEIYKHTIFLFGGQQFLDASPLCNFNDLWTLDLDANDMNNNLTWIDQTKNVLGEPPAPRHGFTMTKMNKYFVIFGGRGDKNVNYQDLWVLDAKKLEWIKPEIHGIEPSPRFSHQAIKINESEIVILGGSTQGLRKQRKIHILTGLPQDKEEQRKSEEANTNGQKIGNGNRLVGRLQKTLSEANEEVNTKFKSSHNLD